MAELQPLRALHYNLDRTGGLQDVVAPPYDVIDAEQRRELAARSPYNVVLIDLPQGNGDPYAHAARQLAEWRRDGVVVADDQPALWPLAQEYTGPDGRRRTRRGFLARVRVTEYGAGRIRPHERTHPGPKEDRLRLTRATKANLSPIFSLFSDPSGATWGALEGFTEGPPWAETIDDDGTVNRLWRVEDPATIDAVSRAVAPAELLIADGHHRYETARVYAEEVGGDGPQDFVLMCLVALQDPGLTVFPTHRLVRGLRPDQHERLADALRQVRAPGLVDPAFERDLEDGDPRLGGQTRGWLLDAAPAQRVGERRSERCELDQLALLKLGARSDDGLALARQLPALPDESASGLEARSRSVDRRQ